MQAVKEIYADSVGVAMAYAFQVDDVARATGMSAEESSRWIQIADDMRLEYDELKTAMRFAIQQGIDPSIEGMKRLAEQYVAIQDPLARSQFLIENFGRSGLNMGRLLENGAAGIDELNNGVNKFLILGEDSVEQVKDYYGELDTLTESFDALKIQASLIAAAMNVDWS